MDKFNFLVWKKNNFLKACFKIFKNQLLDILFKDIKGELQKRGWNILFYTIQHKIVHCDGPIYYLYHCNCFTSSQRGCLQNILGLFSQNGATKRNILYV